MRATYSVLLLNKRTLESFYDFYPLFLETLAGKEVDVCQWFESGTTIDSALPGLRTLTDDKKEWRAIVVRIEDDGEEAIPSADCNNPYDFGVKDAEDLLARDEAVPLIRLTHMLGGIPAPDVEFKKEIVNEKNKAPRIIYQPVAGEVNEKYTCLSQQYDFDGRRPSEIILISLRTKPENDFEESWQSWTIQKETKSSEFWKRNCYPSSCRFLFFETRPEGPVQKVADYFRLWTSVLLLSTNEIDPSALQAYKLYRMDALIDEAELSRVMRTTVNRLVGAQNTIQENIKQDLIANIKESSELPDYRVEIPVELQYSSRDLVLPNSSSFHLLPPTLSTDLAAWFRMREEAETSLHKAFRSVSRHLNRSTDHLRAGSMVLRSELKSLDQYEIEYFEDELSESYSKILGQRRQLARGAEALQDQLDQASGLVKERLMERVTQGQLFAALGIVSGLIVLSFIPTIYLLRQGQGKIAWGLLWLLPVMLAVTSLCAFLVVGWKKYRLDRSVRRYAGKLKDHQAGLSKNMHEYSDYLSEIGSFNKGSVFLQDMVNRSFLNETQISKRKTHLTAIDILLKKLETWGKAFQLGIDYSGDEVETGVDVDLDRSPLVNPFYTFDSTDRYKVPFNQAGDFIASPFEFVERFILTREELYDE